MSASSVKNVNCDLFESEAPWCWFLKTPPSTSSRAPFSGIMTQTEQHLVLKSRQRLQNFHPLSLLCYFHFTQKMPSEMLTFPSTPISPLTTYTVLNKIKQHSMHSLQNNQQNRNRNGRAFFPAFIKIDLTQYSYTVQYTRFKILYKQNLSKFGVPWHAIASEYKKL